MKLKSIVLALLLATIGCSKTNTAVNTPKQEEKAPEGWKFITPNKYAKYMVPSGWSKTTNGYNAPGKIAYSRYIMSSKIKEKDYEAYVQQITNDFTSNGFELLFVKQLKDAKTYLLFFKTETEYLVLLINNKNSKTHHLGCGGKLYLSKQTVPFCNMILSSFHST